MKKGETGLQIRFEILNLLFRNPQMSIKVPSARELAEKFGVARCTAALELKKLSEEGYLIGRRGSGTYTNPKQMVDCKYIPGKRIFGILVGDTRRFIMGHASWAHMAYFGLNLSSAIAYPRIINLSSPMDYERSITEIRASGIDALIWIFPEGNSPFERIMETLKADGVPVLLASGISDKIPTIRFDLEQSGVDIAKILVEENRTRVAWDYAELDALITIRFQAAQKYFQAHGKKMDSSWNRRDIVEFFTHLESRLAAGECPDAIVCHGDHLMAIRNLLQKYQIDMNQDCRLVANWFELPYTPDFRGIVQTESIETLCSVGIDLICRQLNGEDVPLLTKIPVEIKKHNYKEKEIG